MTSGRTEWRGPAEVAAVGSESYTEILICGSESQNRFLSQYSIINDLK